MADYTLLYMLGDDHKALHGARNYREAYDLATRLINIKSAHNVRIERPTGRTDYLRKQKDSDRPLTVYSQ